MKLKGQLIKWDQKRGFGFIRSDEQESDIFVHFSALKNAGISAKVGTTLYFKLAQDNQNRFQAYDLSLNNQSTQASTQKHSAKTRSQQQKKPRVAKNNQSSIALIAFAFFVVIFILVRTIDTSPVTHDNTQSETHSNSSGGQINNSTTNTTDFSQFSCQGKQHCAQMTSCEEAKFYLKNCPNVKIDGDKDGIPCERQHCKFF